MHKMRHMGQLTLLGLFFQYSGVVVWSALAFTLFCEAFRKFFLFIIKVHTPRLPKALSIGSQKSDIPAYLVTYVFVCHSTVYAGPSIGKKIKTYRHTPCPTTAKIVFLLSRMSTKIDIRIASLVDDGDDTTMSITTTMTATVTWFCRRQRYNDGDHNDDDGNC